MVVQNRIQSKRTPREVADLLHMRQEEKLASDVYSTFHEIWHLRIFNDVAISEQRHTDAVRSLLERFSLSDLVADNKRGLFADRELVDQYNQLTHQGRVAAELEELDIRDLQEALSNATHLMITNVYGRLQQASGRHQRAFIQQLHNHKVHYKALHLTQEEFNYVVGI